MSLIIYKIPVCRNQLIIAKNLLEDQFKLERTSIDKYVLYNDALLIYPRKDLFKKLAYSDSFYGFGLKGYPEFYIYPTHLYNYIQRYYRKKITEALLKDLIPLNFPTLH